MPLWLDLRPEPVYAVLHTPPGTPRTRLAVLILPMFGWDSDCSYRARRDWASRLAQAGVTAARIDFPGTENSVGSPLESGRLASWIEATREATGWLREVSGCERLVVIGIGLGGLVAYQAAAQGGPIDDLVLWATRANGRAQLRELRAYATVASGETGDEPEAPRSDGVISIAGHVISEETAEALNALGIAGVPLPHADRRRVLLIGRDAHGVDTKLREHLADTGAELTVLEADDYEALVALPELRLTPDKTIAASIAWIEEGAERSLEPAPVTIPELVPTGTDSIEFTQDGVSVRERILEFETTSGRLVGILTEPVDGRRAASYCLVGINAGELRQTGPNRIPVRVARQAAATGIPMLRVDLPSLGDSDGEAVRTFNRTFEDDTEILYAIGEIYEHLRTLGVAERFVQVGLCLGAYYAIRSALQDSSTVGAIAINPPTFRWRPLHRETLRRGLAAIAPEVVAPARHRSGVSGALAPVIAGVTHARRILELHARRRVAHLTILWRLARRAGAADARSALEQLASNEARVLLLLSEDETVLRLLTEPKLAARVASIPTVAVHRLPTHDHIVRPLPSQEAVLHHISTAIGGFLPRDLPPTSARDA